jgi:epidermal growth factor receptor substrate 15
MATTGSKDTSFDDFEASFADLGPVKETAGQRSAAGGAPPSSAGSGGFEDAFDDDADFDFVPSFGSGGQPSAAAGGQDNIDAQQPFGSAAPSSTANDNAFDGFDDAFGGAPQQSSTTSAAPQRSSTGGAAPPINFGSYGNFPSSTQTGRGGATGANTSHSGGTDSSAFSFEDAFAPSGDAAAVAPPAAAPVSYSSGAPDSSYSNNNNNSYYAPPPGPPPPETGANSGLSVPQQSGNNATGSAGSGPPRASPALADDAPPVRQLAGMGFPRHKVIAALEKSNYRVERALERLLAES